MKNYRVILGNGQKTKAKLISQHKANQKLKQVAQFPGEEYLTKERCHAKFLEGHLNELGPNKSDSFINKAALFVGANQEA